MKDHPSAVWITLNASYYIAPLCDPSRLMDDAHQLLEGAHGITQSLSDLLGQGVDIHPDDLAHALSGASMLIEMGQRSAEEGHGRIRRLCREVSQADDAE
jgi:hypothetical protein